MGGGPGNFGTSASMGAANFARNGNFGPGGPIMPVGARFGVYCGCFARVSGLIILLKTLLRFGTQATTLIIT